MKSCIISGSFDPITNGHLWLLKEALQMFDKIFFVVGTNSAKQHFFDQGTRIALVIRAIEQCFSAEEVSRIQVLPLPPKQMLVDFAIEQNCTVILRGLRNSTDFEYEYGIDLVQRRRHPDIRTIFLITPREYTEISSSLVRQLAGLQGWELVVSDFVPTIILQALQERIKINGNKK